MKLKVLTAALVMGLATQAVQASGFALIEQSASAQGLSYAGAAANAEDTSVMWFNPAGLTEIESQQAILGGHVIAPKMAFENKNSSNGAAAIGANDNGATIGFIPNLYWKTSFDDIDFGLGINVPFGQHISYDEDWVGRYHATETDLKTLNINPAIAKRVNDKLSVGFGLNAQYVDITMEQKINQSAISVLLPDGNAKVTGSNWAFGYNLGLSYQASVQTSLALAYRSQITHDVNGKVRYRDLHAAVAATNYDAAATASVTLPATLTAALDHQLDNKTQILASATWTGWKAYDELVVDFANGADDSESNQNFKDSMRYALGMGYQMNGTTKLRAGIAYDESPVPNAASRSPRTPDIDRIWLSVGVGYKLADDMNLDLGYTHIFADKAAVNYAQTTALGTNTLNGEYDLAVDIFSAQLVWNY
ncbi:OmpP1/FadL family transporter [Thiomicrorhabdus sediminis]|uniref:Transporter n=1 Tax=Thiomicrorhabdus sediminis TaxID=2580412 RepID=A0A4P9K5A6_9GAMM|nr:outer membrane protein transport protein [Thiomicrorhabdus sediminis]QCU89630.1 transporter [Thiomicrorhabdus sediminis]